MTRRTRLITALVVVVLGTALCGVLPPLMFEVDEDHWPRRMFGALVHNPIGVLVLLWHGAIFAAISLACVWAGKRLTWWWALLVVVWALPWTCWIDRTSAGMVSVHGWLYHIGIRIPSVDASGLLAWIDVHAEMALVASGIATAALLWLPTRSRLVLAVALSASVIPVLYFWVPVWLRNQQMGRGWAGLVSAAWMLSVGSALFAWARRAPRNEGVCDGCGYDIRRLTTGVCPECGRPYSEGAPSPS